MRMQKNAENLSTYIYPHMFLQKKATDRSRGIEKKDNRFALTSTVNSHCFEELICMGSREQVQAYTSPAPLLTTANLTIHSAN